MWDDLLIAAGDVLLAFLPDPSEADFVADVVETRAGNRFPGRSRYKVLLRPLTRQPAGWYICRKKHLPLLQMGRRVFVAVRKDKVVRVSKLCQADKIPANKPEKELKS